MTIYRVQTENVNIGGEFPAAYFSTMEKAIDYAKAFQVDFQVVCLRPGKVYSLRSDKEECIKAGKVLRPTFITVEKIDEV